MEYGEQNSTAFAISMQLRNHEIHSAAELQPKEEVINRRDAMDAEKLNRRQPPRPSRLCG